MSKQISGKELVDVKISQINFDLHSENIQNLIYYDKEAMNERVRLTDLKEAEESGITKGIKKGKKEILTIIFQFLS